MRYVNVTIFSRLNCWRRGQGCCCLCLYPLHRLQISSPAFYPQISLVFTYKMATDPETISNFLSEQREAAPEDLQQSFLTIEDFWDRKLWHQLTGVLVEYFHNPDSASQRLPLFRHFILSFSEKINQLKFVYLGLLAATQCAGRLIPINF